MTTETLWRSLSAVDARPGHLNAKRIEAGIDLLAAVDDQGMRHALVELPGSELNFQDDQSRGLSVRGEQLVVNCGHERPYLNLTCTDPASNTLFALVVADLLERMRTETNPVRAVTATLAKWRRFWGKTPSTPLTAERLRGLFGELWFLRVWLMRHGPGHVHHWMGPARACHDFQWPDKAVEVKTTVSTRGHVHIINGLEQMIPPERGELYVLSIRLREEAGAANTLPRLVRGVQDALPDHPLELEAFENKLIEADYSPEHDSYYETKRYRVMEERLYRVSEGFPRLVPRSFVDGPPDGVEAVTYTINLAVCPDLCVGDAAESPGIEFRLSREPGVR